MRILSAEDVVRFTPLVKRTVDAILEALPASRRYLSLTAYEDVMLAGAIGLLAARRTAAQATVDAEEWARLWIEAVTLEWLVAGTWRPPEIRRIGQPADPA